MVRYRTISLPHLNYKVYVRRLVKMPDDLPDCDAYWESISTRESAIYLKPSAPCTTAAHELVHVMQHICQVRNMIIERESEHMACVMQYLLMQVYGFTYRNPAKDDPYARPRRVRKK